jgi:K+-transporting ATPase ATPase C chain
VDLVTASASGLDPHISLAAARYQAARVANARGLSTEQMQQLIDANTDARLLAALGEPVVNVLALNWALDHPSTRATTAGRAAPTTETEWGNPTLIRWGNPHHAGH